jgi:hypothetical protein
MRTRAPWTEPFQHVTDEIRDQFWGDVYRHTREVWQRALERLSVAARDQHLGVQEYERVPGRADRRNGF